MFPQILALKFGHNYVKFQPATVSSSITGLFSSCESDKVKSFLTSKLASLSIGFNNTNVEPE